MPDASLSATPGPAAAAAAAPAPAPMPAANVGVSGVHALPPPAPPDLSHGMIPIGTAVSIGVWLLTVALGLGGYLAGYRALESRVVSMEADLRAHAALPGHPVGEERQRGIDKRLESIEGTLSKIQVQLENQGRTLSALCQANPAGACRASP